MEAYNIIESLVGTPPINDAKTEVTLEHIMERLESIEKNLPCLDKINEIDKKLCNNIDRLDGFLKHITKRINVLESIKVKNDEPSRIDK